MAKNKVKIAIISSGGGHFFQLLQLKNFWNKYDHFWIVCNSQKDYLSREKENIFFGYCPDSRNIINLIRNFIFAFIIINQQRPKIMISCGAAIAIPYFVIGKFLFHTKLIFIEPYDFVKKPSLSGRIAYNFVDLFLVQHAFQKKWFPKAKFWGSLL